jgi:acetoin utilization deacetylase AcuC-like enzyme
MSAELLMIEQRRGSGETAALWVREGSRRLPGQDSDERLAELHAGLRRHAGVRAVAADAGDDALERTLVSLHERGYLEALAGLDGGEPVVLSEFAPPGLEPDIPVHAGLVAAAREGVRTAITAADRVVAGARYTYAVCRPPGHHAGPAFQAGYCYLNNAAAAVWTLCAGGVKPVGVLDLDLHYPNGTSALVERMEGVTLHSLHAAPVTNLPPGAVLPRISRERVVAFERSPSPATYVAEVAVSIAALAARAQALVVSLGYDTVAGDPHGSWGFQPEIFTEIGALLARSGRPICVIQEGGYSLPSLAACSHAFATGLLGEPDP